MISDQSVTTAARAGQIVDQLFDVDSALSREIRQFKTDYSDHLWDLYFRTYDALVPFSPGYRDLFARASRALPARGIIADYGYGTGNGLLMLKLAAPERTLIGTEPSAIGRARARAKLAAYPATRAGLSDQDIFTYDLADESVDGAILVNVLYTIPTARRLEALRVIYRHLKPRARLVVSDPAASLQDARQETVRLFAKRFLSEALHEGAEPTEFELALFAFINIHALIGANTFLNAAELEDLCRSAGFVIMSRSPAYYDVSHFVVLEKP